MVVHNSVLRQDYFFHVATAPSGPRPPHCRGFTITPRQVTMGRTPLDERSARRTDLYLTAHTHNTHKREISMPRRDSNPQSQQGATADPRFRPRGHLSKLNMDEYRPVGEILIEGTWKHWEWNILQCHLLHHKSRKHFLGIEPGTPRYSATYRPLKLRHHRILLPTLNADSFGCPRDGHILSHQYSTVTHVDKSCPAERTCFTIFKFMLRCVVTDFFLITNQTH